MRAEIEVVSVVVFALKFVLHLMSMVVVVVALEAKLGDRRSTARSSCHGDGAGGGGGDISFSSSCFTPASASHTHTPTPTEQHPRGHQATTHHDPPATTVRDRTPEALNALTSVATSAASQPQQRRALGLHRAFSSVAPSVASRPQPLCRQ
ncbi:hypothetical protein HN51_027460, partial [Arachis hypogaea]